MSTSGPSKFGFTSIIIPSPTKPLYILTQLPTAAFYGKSPRNTYDTSCTIRLLKGTVCLENISTTEVHNASTTSPYNRTTDLDQALFGRLTAIHTHTPYPRTPYLPSIHLSSTHSNKTSSSTPETPYLHPPPPNIINKHSLQRQRCHEPKPIEFRLFCKACTSAKRRIRNDALKVPQRLSSRRAHDF